MEWRPPVTPRHGKSLRSPSGSSAVSWTQGRSSISRVIDRLASGCPAEATDLGRPGPQGWRGTAEGVGGSDVGLWVRGPTGTGAVETGRNRTPDPYLKRQSTRVLTYFSSGKPFVGHLHSDRESPRTRLHRLMSRSTTDGSEDQFNGRKETSPISRTSVTLWFRTKRTLKRLKP